MIKGNSPCQDRIQGRDAPVRVLQEVDVYYGSSQLRLHGDGGCANSQRKPSFCHKIRLLCLPALARSQKIGRANCFRGDLPVITAFNRGTIPEDAASSWRALDKRHIEYMVWKICEQISCVTSA